MKLRLFYKNILSNIILLLIHKYISVKLFFYLITCKNFGIVSFFIYVLIGSNF